MNKVFQKLIQRKQKHGCLSTVVYLLRYISYNFVCVLVPAIVLSGVFILLLPFVKIRLVKLFSDRIGHYALNTELMLCTLEQVKSNRKIKYLFYTCSSSVPMCNTQLHIMWRRVIPVFPFPDIAWKTDKILTCILGDRYALDPIKQQFEPSSGDKNIDGLLQVTKHSHLHFTDSENILGLNIMQDLGLPDKSKFICIMIRDADYLKKHLPGLEWDYHDYRNASIDQYAKAALFLANKGYYVIRMGKYVEHTFEVDHPNIIDYACHALRSDFMDIFLLSRCYFFISNSTGLDSVPQVFRKPALLTDLPLPAGIPTWYPCLCIAKKTVCSVTKRLLTFKEVHEMYLKSRPITSAILKSLNVSLVDNSSDDILDVVIEMEARLHGSWLENPSDESLQRQFWIDFPVSFENSKGSLMHAQNINIRMGSHFLRDNQ